MAVLDLAQLDQTVGATGLPVDGLATSILARKDRVCAGA